MIPIMLTLLRVILTPFIVYFLVNYNILYALILFSVAIVTDILDGSLARYLNQVSALGAALDPLADKVLLLSSYIALHYISLFNVYVPQWFLLSVLIKELIQIIAGLVVYMQGYAYLIKPSILGKMTTVVQSIFLVVIISSPYCNSDVFFNSLLVSNLIMYSSVLILILHVLVLAHYGINIYKGLAWNASK